MPLAGSFLVLLVGTYLWSGTLQPLYVDRADRPGREAQAWIKTNLAGTSVIVGGDDLLAYLREPQDGPVFAGFQEHWKVANDPVVRRQLGYDWTGIDYLVIDPHQLADLYRTHNWLALTALAHAHRVAAWTFVNSAPGPFHPDQLLEIWEVDRLSDASLDGLGGAQLRSRNELCGPRVATCDDLVGRPPPTAVDLATRPEPIPPR